MTSSDTANETNIFYDEQDQAGFMKNSNFQVIAPDQDQDARRQSLATEAIEQLASGINLAANTIEEYSQNVSYKKWITKVHKSARADTDNDQFIASRVRIEVNIFKQKAG